MGILVTLRRATSVELGGGGILRVLRERRWGGDGGVGDGLQFQFQFGNFADRFVAALYDELSGIFDVEAAGALLGESGKARSAVELDKLRHLINLLFMLAQLDLVEKSYLSDEDSDLESYRERNHKSMRCLMASSTAAAAADGV